MRPEPGQRCTPKPASYFEACISAIETRPAHPLFGQFDEPFWTCVYADTQSTSRELQWFESCVEESPAACDSAGYLPAPDTDAGADGGTDAGADTGPGDAG